MQICDHEKEIWCVGMTPSEQCKAAGLKSLAELAQISGVSVQTLINWHRDKPALFATVVAGAVVIKAANVKVKGSAQPNTLPKE